MLSLGNNSLPGRLEPASPECRALARCIEGQSRFDTGHKPALLSTGGVFPRKGEHLPVLIGTCNVEIDLRISFACTTCASQVIHFRIRHHCLAYPPFRRRNVPTELPLAFKLPLMSHWPQPLDWQPTNTTYSTIYLSYCVMSMGLE